VRLHQTLGYQSPDQYEAENAPALAAQINAPPVSESLGLSQTTYAKEGGLFQSRR